MKTNGLALILTVVLLCMPSIAASQASMIAGQVTDSEGAVIANARVLLHWDSSGSTVGLSDNIGTKNDVVVTTDANGGYEATVNSGFYDVFISSPAFTPVAAKVRVKQGQRVTLSVKLNIDPLVSKELAYDVSAAPEP